jgi:hypothetical protein
MNKIKAQSQIKTDTGRMQKQTRSKSSTGKCYHKRKQSRVAHKITFTSIGETPSFENDESPPGSDVGEQI